jgi:hypothetical protein
MNPHRKLFNLATVLAVVCFIVSEKAKAASIGTVETQPSGTAVAIGDIGSGDPTPVITAILSQPSTVNGTTYTNWSFLANDGTGSLDMFGHMPVGSTYVPTLGDGISASGTYSPFDQIPEIGSLTAISQLSVGNPVPSPGTATIPQLNITTQTLGASGNAEFLWTLNNVMISSGSTVLTAGETWGNGMTSSAGNMTLTITDSSSNSMELFYWQSSYSLTNANLYGLVIPQGTPVNITGFADVFGTGLTAAAEFVPLTVTAVPEPSAIILGGLSLVGLLAIRRANRAKN